MEAEFHQALTEGDQPLLERLTTNLFDNAVRHNEAGGWLRVWTGLHDGHPALRVTNSGPVIEPDQLELLRQPFQRSGGDGLGIGLSIVDAITTAHGATLTTTPLPTGGLDILIEFPPPPLHSPIPDRRAPT